MATRPAQIVHRSINRNWREVYKFVHKPENMPLWASGLSSGLDRDGDDWIAHGVLGSVKVSFAPANDFGVIDHTVTMENGIRVYNALRIVANGDGCEVLFMLLRLDDMTDDKFAADAAHIAKDFATLKEIMEK